MSFKILRKEILKLSKSKDWSKAREEWTLKNIYFSSGGTCLCSHFPITEHCVIKNTQNNKEVVVGNCCIKQFMVHIKSNKIFSCLSRIKRGGNSYNKEIIKLLFDRDILTDWEYKFYLDIWRKRNLTQKQELFKDKINTKIKAYFDIGGSK